MIDHITRFTLKDGVILSFMRLSSPSQGNQEKAPHGHINGKSYEVAEREYRIGRLSDNIQ
jgi:hypothetical protein